MKTTIPRARRRYARMFAPDLSKGSNSMLDGRVLPFAEAEEMRNIVAVSGALKNGYGADATAVPALYDKVFYYAAFDEDAGTEKGFYLAHRAADGKMFGGDGAPDTWREIAGAVFSEPPMGTRYRLYGDDVFLLCGKEGMAVIDKTLQAVTVPSAPSITSIAMHNERMFATVGGRRNAVWFSDDLDPTNWNPELDEGGFIEMEGERGRLQRVVAFSGYVYVFRDHGISRLSALGEQSDFSVRHLFVAGGKIFADTVAVCGDRILFLASDGLYAFDGLSTRRICRKTDGLIVPADTAQGCYCDGKYYLAAGTGANGNDLLAVIDPIMQSVSVNDVAVTAFSPLTRGAEQTLWIHSPDKAVWGEVRQGADKFGTPFTRVWQSGDGDMGAPDRRKLFTDLWLDTKYPLSVTVRTERGEKTFRFAGKRTAERKRLNLIGTKLQIRIEATGDIDAARLAVRYANIG